MQVGDRSTVASTLKRSKCSVKIVMNIPETIQREKLGAAVVPA